MTTTTVCYRCPRKEGVHHTVNSYVKMYNAWNGRVGSHNHNQLHEQISISHELDGVTFKLSNSFSSPNHQMLDELLQQMNSANFGNLNQYSYDFKLEERVLERLNNTKERQ